MWGRGGRLLRGRGGVSDFYRSSERAGVFLNTFRFFSFGYPLSFLLPSRGFPKADADCGSTNVTKTTITTTTSVTKRFLRPEGAPRNVFSKVEHTQNPCPASATFHVIRLQFPQPLCNNNP